MNVDVLAFGAHPDDVELGCGATLAKLVASGKSVGVVDLTCGELGTRGSASMRIQESEAASKILGVSSRENLGFADGFFTNDKLHQLEVVRVIRKYKPKIVICNAVKDRHIDHCKAAKLVADSCFLSGLVKIKTQNQGEAQEFWRPQQVFHYIQWQPIEPDFVVDVSDFMQIKKRAVLSYASQFYNPNVKDIPTPISSKNFLESVTYRAKDLGRLVGVAYAEGFTSNHLLKISNLFDLL